jgi:ADP-ribosylglycohydrolase
MSDLVRADDALRRDRAAGLMLGAAVGGALGADWTRADTVACVTGAIAGSLCGAGAIPVRWRTHVHGRVRTAACSSSGLTS